MRARIIRFDCFYHIYRTVDPFSTKFNWMVHHHKLEWVSWYFEPSQPQRITLGLKQTSICPLSVFCVKIRFFFKVTEKVQNFIESVCILYLLYHRSLGNQSRCADLLVLLITKPSTPKWACTDSGTLTHSITRHTTGRWEGGYFAAQGDKPCNIMTSRLL